MRDYTVKLPRMKLLEKLQSLQVKNRKFELEMDCYNWEDIEVPLQLTDALKDLTKDDLYQLAKNNMLTKTSALKKQELLDRLVSSVPTAIWSLLSWITEDHYVILKKLVDRGGHMSAQSVDTGHLKLLLQSGIIFAGNINEKPSLVMAQEVVQEVKKIDFKRIKPVVLRNTRWVKLTRGLLYYYGFLSFEDLLVLLKKYTDEEVDKWEVRCVLDYALGEDDDIEHNRYGVHQFYARNPEQVKQEHEMRATLDYYPFAEQQLLSAGEPEYIDRDESYLDLVEFLLDTFDMDYEDADAIVEECMIEIRNGAFPSDLLGLLQEQLELAQTDVVNKLVDKLMHVYNHTRQWSLKGYSPNLMSSKRESATGAPKADIINFSTRQKVGRNDPCPCGSGRKFKKCCGS
jgi:hypothetical protein